MTDEQRMRKITALANRLQKHCIGAMRNATRRGTATPGTVRAESAQKLMDDHSYAFDKALQELRAMGVTVPVTDETPLDPMD